MIPGTQVTSQIMTNGRQVTRVSTSVSQVLVVSTGSLVVVVLYGSGRKEGLLVHLGGQVVARRHSVVFYESVLWSGHTSRPRKSVPVEHKASQVKG